MSNLNEVTLNPAQVTYVAPKGQRGKLGPQRAEESFMQYQERLRVSRMERADRQRANRLSMRDTIANKAMDIMSQNRQDITTQSTIVERVSNVHSGDRNIRLGTQGGFIDQTQAVYMAVNSEYPEEYRERRDHTTRTLPNGEVIKGMKTIFHKETSTLSRRVLEIVQGLTLKFDGFSRPVGKRNTEYSEKKFRKFAIMSKLMDELRANGEVCRNDPFAMIRTEPKQSYSTPEPKVLSTQPWLWREYRASEMVDMVTVSNRLGKSRNAKSETIHIFGNVKGIKPAAKPMPLAVEYVHTPIVPIPAIPHTPILDGNKDTMGTNSERLASHGKKLRAEGVKASSDGMLLTRYVDGRIGGIYPDSVTFEKQRALPVLYSLLSAVPQSNALVVEGSCDPTKALTGKYRMVDRSATMPVKRAVALRGASVDAWARLRGNPSVVGPYNVLPEVTTTR